MAFGIIDQVRMNTYETMLEELKMDYGLLRKIDTNDTIFFKENIITNKKAFTFPANITEESTTVFEKSINNLYGSLSWNNREMIITKVRDIFEMWADEHDHISGIVIDHLAT